MMSFLFNLIAWASVGLIQRVLLGAGLTLIVYSGVSELAESLLNSVSSNFSQLPSAMFQLAMLSGIGESLSILGSAVLSRIAISMASNIAGLRQS
jgi:hypothetical protein